MGGYPKQLHFLTSLEFSLVAKCNEHFIKKISQLKSDIRSCRCKNFSLKQASGLTGAEEGGSSGPPGPFPWIRHWLWVQYNENSSKGTIHQRSEGTLTDAKNIP